MTEVGTGMSVGLILSFLDQNLQVHSRSSGVMIRQDLGRKLGLGQVAAVNHVTAGERLF